MVLASVILLIMAATAHGNVSGQVISNTRFIFEFSYILFLPLIVVYHECKGTDSCYIQSISSCIGLRLDMGLHAALNNEVSTICEPEHSSTN